MDGAQDAAAPRRLRASGLIWQKDPEGRRGRVLDAAARLFGERGYAAVSTSEIAAAAGVAEGSLFHYFSSKAGLLKAVGQRYGAEFAAAMFDGIDAAPGPDSIRALVGRAFSFVAASSPGFGLFLLSDERSHLGSSSSAEASVARQANREVVTAAVQSELERWQSAGVVRRMDAAVVAVLLFGLVEAALRACFAQGPQREVERFVDETVTAMTRMLEVAPSEPR